MLDVSRHRIKLEEYDAFHFSITYILNFVKVITVVL